MSSTPDSYNIDADAIEDALARDEQRARRHRRESLASIDRPPSEDLPSAKIYHPLSLPVLALLAPASIFGVLARLGLLSLGTYDGQAIFPLAYVQAAGCLMMGLGLGLKESLGRFYGPLYTAMTTGFCGSLTTFSGWQLDIFESWTNAGQFHRSPLRNTVDGIGKTVFTLSLSLASLAFGVHLASLIALRTSALSPPSRVFRRILTLSAVLIYGATFVAYFRLSPSFRRKATAALVFSYPGTLTRYLLSLILNPFVSTFPLGTFAANMLGTALLGAIRLMQSMVEPVSINRCRVLQGLGDGYCGCLTTVSTFAAEADALKGWRAWFYVAASWGTGQIILLLVLEPPLWAGYTTSVVSCRT